MYGLAVVDVFVTTISLHGGGPVTNAMLRAAGRLLTARRPERGDVTAGRPLARAFARYSNLLLTLTLFLGWVTLVLAGATLMLVGGRLGAVATSSGEVPADGFELLYFAGVAITTLGFGDFVPDGTGWRYFTVALATTGLVVSSLGIAYVVNVVGASLQQRTLARRIHGLGATPRALLAAGWDGDSFGGLDAALGDLAAELVAHTQQHLSYPMIHYVRSDERHDSLPANVAVLDEALSVLLVDVPRERQPSTSALVAARRAVTAYLMSIEEIYLDDEHADLPAWPSVDFLGRFWNLPPGRGLRDLDGDELLGLERRRRLLHAAVLSQGRTWDDAMSSGDSPDARLDVDLFASAYAVPPAQSRLLSAVHRREHDPADLPQ